MMLPEHCGRFPLIYPTRGRGYRVHMRTAPPPPAYRMVDLYFPDYDTAGAAVTTAEAAALFPSIFGLATGGLRTAFADIEES